MAIYPTPQATSDFAPYYADAALYAGAFLQAQAQIDKIYPRLVRQLPPTVAQAGGGNAPISERWRDRSGVAPAGWGAEGSTINVAAGFTPHTKVCAYQRQNGTIAMTQEAQTFGNAAGFIDDMSSAAMDFEYKKELWVTAAFRGGFTAPASMNSANTPSNLDLSTLCPWDGKALYATDHVLKGSSLTNSNSSTRALSEDSLRSAIQAGLEMKDELGRLAPVTYDILLVPPKLKDKAIQLTKTETIVQIMRSLVANPNDPTKATDQSPFAVNPRRAEGIEAICHPMLAGAVTAASGLGLAGSDTAWYLIDSKNIDLRMFMLTEAPVFERSRVSEKLTDYMTWHQFVALGTGGYRWTFGSTGATAE